MVHVYFDEGDAQPSTSQPAAAAAAAQVLQPLRAPTCVTKMSVDGQPTRDPTYVFRLSYSSPANALATSLSSNIIKAYSAQGPQLGHVLDLKGHTNSITDVGFLVADSPSTLHSSSADGTVRGWDLRSGKQTESYGQGPSTALFSFSIWAHVVAAGGDGQVLFWDRRNGKQLAHLDDTHMEDVTQVRFHSSGKVISASTDGLIAVHDVTQSFDDDQSFQAALNVGNSVEEVGMYGPQGERLWVRTGTESLHLWEWGRALTDDMEGGHGAFADFVDARSTATQAAGCSEAAAVFEQVDYLAGCHYDPASQQLMLLAGSNEGSLGFFPLVEQAAAAGGMLTGAQMACPALVLHGGHNTVVRTVQCYQDAAGPFCATGGEDGLICVWPLASQGVQSLPQAAVAAAQESAPMDADMARVSPGPDRGHAKPFKASKVFRKKSPY